MTVFLFLSLAAMVPPATFMQPDDTVALPLAGIVYLCGMTLLVRSQSAAARQSGQGRRRFYFGIALVALAPLSLWVISFDVGGISYVSSCWGIGFLILTIAGLAGIMAHLNGNEGGRSYVFGILVLCLSLLSMLAAVSLSGIVYLCAVGSLIDTRPAAARESQRGRRRFCLGIALVILAAVIHLWIGANIVGLIAVLGAIGPPPSLSLSHHTIPLAMFGCGVYQLLRLRSRSPDRDANVGVKGPQQASPNGDVEMTPSPSSPAGDDPQ
jgi:hypothetical protein